MAATPLRHVARVCERVCRPFGIKSPLHQRRVDFFVTNRAFDISRAIHEVGFHPSVSLLDGVTRTPHWYQPQKWL
jgi:nucleoside-diphosphate-sugar epimerase